MKIAKVTALLLLLLAGCQNNADRIKQAKKLQAQGNAREAYRIVSDPALTENMDARFLQAELLFKGEGIKRNPQQVVELLTPMADRGNARAQNALTTIYISPGPWYNGQKAIYYALLAANQGDIQANYNLGLIYGFAFAGRADKTLAIKYLSLAASKGNAHASALMASLLDDTEKKKKCQLFGDAAQGGDTEGAFYYARCLASGEGGITDFKQAAHWYQFAAEKGYPLAQANLGYLYEQGLGITKSRASAIRWYCKAQDDIPAAHYRLRQWQIDCQHLQIMTGAAW